jgi:hypothetical protein
MAIPWNLITGNAKQQIAIAPAFKKADDGLHVNDVLVPAAHDH